MMLVALYLGMIRMRNLSNVFFLFLCLALAMPAHADLAEDQAIAARALAESRFDEAVKQYSAILEQYPDDGQSHYYLGSALMSLGKLNEAATQFEAAGELGFQPMGVGYRLARISARQGDTDAAIAYLDDIASQGFPAPQLIENEADFDALKQDARFQAALQLIRSNRFPCRNNPKNREFDFWVGEWNVTALGQQAGTNDIKLILGDCVLFENWSSASGTFGKSFNFYDANEDHWRQIWVDDTGGVVEFTGNFRDGVLYYTGVTHDPASGAEMLHKLTFTPNANGSVRQLWEQSTDAGETWQVAFDGLYQRL